MLRTVAKYAQEDLLVDIHRQDDIVCRDGFRSGTFTPADFTELLAPFGISPRIEEVDGSSVCCAFAVP